MRLKVFYLIAFLLSFGLLDAQVYDSSGSYTVPAGVSNIKVTAWGGGGGGGSRTTNGGGGGGGAGAYSYAEIPVTQGQVVTITIGNGGAAGSAGGDTTVAIGSTTYVLAKGGSGVANNTTTGGVGGQASAGIGTTKLNGGNGADSVSNNGGKGGDSPNGGKGGAGAISQGSGTAGNVPGGGGGGAKRTSFGTQNGGTGGKGRVILDGYSYNGSGSRDLYPLGAYGGRAALRSSTLESFSYPYPTLGQHFVYAVEGETISLASSAQSGTNNRTRLYNPSGTQVSLSFSSGDGNIANRTAELNGPRLPGVNTGSEYKAIYYQVPTGGTGIYRVEFDGTGANNANRSDFKADANWTQGSSSIYIMAWDISVANVAKSGWQKGRVYSTVLNMDIATYTGTQSTDPFMGDDTNFYGKYKVLTKDGFLYNVENNGNNGISFTFMVNNKGFYTPGDPTQASYKSIPATSAAAIQNRYHSPLTADGNDTFTQKIFYTYPDNNMPVSSVGAVPGGNTWLKVPKANLHVNAIDFVGAEGTPDQAGNKGGNFLFDSDKDLIYIVRLISPTNAFPERVLTGITTVNGINAAYWDGKDGNGNYLGAGLHDVQATLKLRGAEVHFPYCDMETNPNGIKLEYLDEDNNYNVISDIVYWDDANVTVRGTTSNPITNLIGISSNTNGHKWGKPNSAIVGEFGDEHGMDTWTYIEGNSVMQEFDVDIHIADLEVVSVVSDLNGCVWRGDEITYTVKVKNNGPSDVEKAPFSFIVPVGFEPVSVNFDGNSCGTEFEAISFDPDEGNSYLPGTNQFNSKLNLPNGCEITYTIKVVVAGSSVSGQPEIYGTIMRPNDVTDPDASNPNPLIPPTNPFYECANNGLGGNCNNIKMNDAVKITPRILSAFKSPLTCSIEFTIINIPDGTYDISYDGGEFENVQITGGEGTTAILPTGNYENFEVTYDGCTSTTFEKNIEIPASCCTKPGIFDEGYEIPSNIGISSVRTNNTDGWPQNRQSAWLVLEAKAKGFVPNRLTNLEVAAIPAEDLVSGMMIYNIDEDCLQINIDATLQGWKCISSGCN